MTLKGFSHVGLSTRDLDRTRDFYQHVLGFDPNGIQLEFCCFTRALTADDARMQTRAQISIHRLGLQDPAALSSR